MSILRKLIIVPRAMSFNNCGKEKGNLFPVNFSSAISDNKANNGDNTINKMYLEKVPDTNQNNTLTVQKINKLKYPVKNGLANDNQCPLSGIFSNSKASLAQVAKASANKVMPAKLNTQVSAQIISG